MEARKFDAFIRRFSLARSRRSLVAGSLAATVLGAIGMTESGAKKGGKGGKGGKRTICHCPSGDVNKCQTIRVAKDAANTHLRNHCDYPGPCQEGVVNPCELDNRCLAVIDTEGDVDRESDGTFTATTESNDAFGNLVFGVPSGTTFAELDTLESGFDFETGACGGGAPRFVVFLANDKCPYAQFPPSECGTPGAEGFTGELIGNNEPSVWNDDLCGGNAANNTYDEVLAAYGSVLVESIVLVVDESPVPGVSEKTVNLDPCIAIDTGE